MSLLTSIFGFVYVLLKGVIFLTLGLIVVAIVLFFIIKATTNYTIDGEKLILSKLTHKVEINISDIEKIEDSIWNHWHYNRDFSIWKFTKNQSRNSFKNLKNLLNGDFYFNELFRDFFNCDFSFITLSIIFLPSLANVLIIGTWLNSGSNSVKIKLLHSVVLFFSWGEKVLFHEWVHFESLKREDFLVFHALQIFSKNTQFLSLSSYVNEGVLRDLRTGLREQCTSHERSL